MTSAPLVTPGEVGALLAARREPGEVMIAAAIAESLAGTLRVDLISTDGFLFPNAVLEARGLSLRKGFPESYDIARLRDTLDDVRRAPVRVPGYSHAIYDVDESLSRTIDRPDLLLVEGLGLAPVGDDRSASQALDALIYLDATEEDLEHWFLERFMALWRAAETDPHSFYARFRGMEEMEARGFARTAVWRGMNLPNLQDHIARARPHADVLLWKERDHQLRLVRPQL